MGRQTLLFSLSVPLDVGSANTMYYKLVPQKPIQGVGYQGWNLKLPATVGRSAESQVCVEDESISRSHCQLFLGTDESLQVRDLNSLNGTFVNGERIKKVHSLFPGDVIQVGSITFRVDYASDTDPGKPPPKRATTHNSATQPMKAVRPEDLPVFKPSEPPKKWWEFWK